MREELSLVRKFLPHLALTKSVYPRSTTFWMSFSITVVFRFLETYVTLLHVKSRIPSPVITETYDQRQLTADDFLFRRQGA